MGCVPGPLVLAACAWLLAVLAISLEASPTPAATCSPPIQNCKSCNPDATCRRCQNGYEPAQGSCSPCKVGTFSRTGLKCVACLPGQSTAAPASSACTVCAAGYGMKPLTGRCRPCLAGSYSPGNTTDACRNCHPGTTSEDKAVSCHGVDPGARTQVLLSVYVTGPACPAGAAMQSAASGALLSLPSLAAVRLLGCRPGGTSGRAAVQLLLDLRNSPAGEAASFFAALERATTQEADAAAVFAAVPGLRQPLEANSLELWRACTANYLPSADGTRCECQEGFAPDAAAGGCGVPQNATALVRITVPRLGAPAPVCLRRCQGGSLGPTPTQCNPATFATRGVANVVAWPCSGGGGSGGSLDEAWLLSGSTGLIRSAADPWLCLAVEEDTGDAAKRGNVVVAACNEASPTQRWGRSQVDGSVWLQGPSSQCLSVCNVSTGGCRLRDTSVANVVTRGPCISQQAEQYFEHEALPAAQQVAPRCKIEFSLTKRYAPSSFGLSELVLVGGDGAPIPAGELSASQTSTLSSGGQLLSADACIDGVVEEQPPGICCSAGPEKDPSFRLSVTFPCPRGLSKVVVQNRRDCCQDLISHFSLHFFNSSGAEPHPPYDFSTSIARDTYVVLPDALREPLCSPLCVHGTCFNSSCGPKCACQDGWGGPDCTRKPDGFIYVSASGPDACGIASTNGVSGVILCGALADHEDAASKWVMVSPPGQAFLSVSITGTRLCATGDGDDQRNIMCTEDWRSGEPWRFMEGKAIQVAISGTSVLIENGEDAGFSVWPFGGPFMDWPHFVALSIEQFVRLAIHGIRGAAIGADGVLRITDDVAMHWSVLKRGAAMAVPTQIALSGERVCVTTDDREVWCVLFGGTTWARVDGLLWDFVALGAGDSTASNVTIVGLSNGRIEVASWPPPASQDLICSPLCVRGTCINSTSGPVCDCNEGWLGPDCAAKRIVLSNRQWMMYPLTMATQADARERCHRMGGELVTIFSEEENNLYWMEMDRENAYGRLHSIDSWLGMHAKNDKQTINRADYVWYGSNTRPKGYVPWCWYSPENSQGREGVCMVVANVMYGGCWNDLACHYYANYGCELSL